MAFRNSDSDFAYSVFYTWMYLTRFEDFERKFMKKNILKMNFKKSFAIQSLAAFGLSIGLASAQTNTSEDKNTVGFYLNAGAMGDFNMRGYDSSLLKRDPRVAYQLEMGGAFFAIPVSFSTGQNVDIYAVKPRVQVLYPMAGGAFSVGPGLGFVYNYWKSEVVDILNAGSDVTVHEIGFQPSLQIMIRPVPVFNILITPIAMDVNFWRKVSLNTGFENIGNFSTNNERVGIIYSAGASVGFSF